MEEITNKQLQEQVNNLIQENKQLQEEINKLMIDKINLRKDNKDSMDEGKSWFDWGRVHRHFIYLIGLEDYFDKCINDRNRIIKTKDIIEIINKQKNVEIKFWS